MEKPNSFLQQRQRQRKKSFIRLAPVQWEMTRRERDKCRWRRLSENMLKHGLGKL